MKAPAQGACAAGRYVAPGIAFQIECPSVVKTSGRSKSVRNDHTIPLRVVNAGMAVARIGAARIAAELDPRVRLDVVGPRIAEETCALAGDDDDPAAHGVERHRMAVARIRDRSWRFDLGPLLIDDGIY